MSPAPGAIFELVFRTVVLLGKTLHAYFPVKPNVMVTQTDESFASNNVLCHDTVNVHCTTLSILQLRSLYVNCARKC